MRVLSAEALKATMMCERRSPQTLNIDISLMQYKEPSAEALKAVKRAERRSPQSNDNKRLCKACEPIQLGVPKA